MCVDAWVGAASAAHWHVRTGTCRRGWRDPRVPCPTPPPLPPVTLLPVLSPPCTAPIPLSTASTHGTPPTREEAQRRRRRASSHGDGDGGAFR
eukprot:282763-Rhodomonas_salina.1